eukprot:gene2335-8060_t
MNVPKSTIFVANSSYRTNSPVGSNYVSIFDISFSLSGERGGGGGGGGGGGDGCGSASRTACHPSTGTGAGTVAAAAILGTALSGCIWDGESVIFGYIVWLI